ncbi:MAG: insulinase family protein [Candidatus Euphemobacter frigidus]|nr:insulinase family protein [Candidatus Euphemobacter frigidus]MDP8275628.1 insulinase family protein [Candidatus Euphemobacter frigidus]
MSTKLPQQLLKAGAQLYGFNIVRVTPLPEIGSVAYLAEHIKSGARLLHLHSSDPENLFAIGFRTPPPDDSGLPHILEHTVLCGSKRYPVKDPFVELLKTSLATFLNAMTYPDRTIYPCASMNEKDFFNLAGVYCDAVLYPLISLRHFQQEGHHLEFAEPGNTGSPLIVKGIVYNEMKGIYSDLDGIIGREIVKNLFCDNAYGRDYGGNPESITTLTYERFKDYHRTWYHPSNSLIFIFGNIPPPRHLAFLDVQYLSQFEKAKIDATISDQSVWTAPRQFTVIYPIGAHEKPEGRAAVVAAYRAGRNDRPIETLALHIISHYLIGNAASPLRKALIDSKLGEELTDSGYYSYQRDTYFAVGLKGTEGHRAGRILDLIRGTCARIAEEGLDPGKVEAAFHCLEMASREIKSMYPLRLMDRAFESWSSSDDPLLWMRINHYIVEARRRYSTEPGFLEDRLRKMIVDNPHQLLLSLLPDPAYMAKKEKIESRQMEKVKELFSGSELKRIARDAAELERLQSTPNTPEALATLPRLALADVPIEPVKLNTVIEEVGGRPFLVTDMFSNGLTYIALSFDLRGLGEETVSYLPLFIDALHGMGAAGFDYATMAEREAACSGGIEPDFRVSGTADDPHHVQPHLTVFCKALDRKLPEMLEVLKQRLTLCDLTDRERLKDVVLQGRMARKSRVVPAGSGYAVSFASRRLSENCALNETLKGISGVRFFDRLVARFDRDHRLIEKRLTAIRDLLQSRRRLTISVLGSPESVESVRGWYQGLLGGMRDEEIPRSGDRSSPGDGRREGIATPADIAFVAQSQPAVSFSHPAAPALLLLAQNTSYGYLWEEVRVKGGAYGCSAAYDVGRGTFSFSSYRDPNISHTLQVYGGVFDYIEREMDLSPRAVEQAIIGTIKYLDHPIRPEQAVALALGRYLGRKTPEKIRAFRERLFHLSGDDIRRASTELLRPAFAISSVCVISSREKLEAANRGGGEKFSITDL